MGFEGFDWLLLYDGPLLVIAIVAIVLWQGRIRRGNSSRDLAVLDEEKRRHVENLRDRNRLLELTEAVAEIGHWRLTLDNDEVYWSDGTFAIHGVEPPDTPPLDQAIDVYHPEDREMVAAHVANSRQTGEPFVFEARLIRPDGEIRRVESRGHAEIGPDGKPTALYGMMADRTKELDLRAVALAERDKARAASNAKAEFLAHMSHELRTPMNGILGYADLLLNTGLPDDARRQVQIIAESGKAMVQILNDILDLSQIEAGELSLVRETVDLDSTIEHVVGALKPEANAKGLTLQWEREAQTPSHIEADRLRLRQIIYNLASNAVKYTNAGSIDLSIRSAGGDLIISVSDTGPGVGANQRERIFEPFVQGDATPTRSHGGTGLGLAICRRLATMMGGTLSLADSHTGGSTFVLRLPLHEAEERRVATLKAGREAIQGSPRILLAEDNDINQMLVAEMARQLGVKLEIAEDGAAAVAAVEAARRANNPFRLVLMDLQMPKMGGIEATQTLRQANYIADELPILAVTANAFPEDVEACYRAGMQEHLAKPLSLERLRAAILRWLPPDPVPMGSRERDAA